MVVERAAAVPTPAPASPSSDATGRACRLGYLSGAPRVSTSLEAEAQGPRAHVLGVIGGFVASGWKVDSFILGDRVPVAISRSRYGVVRHPLSALAADVGRLAMRPVSEGQAWRELSGRVDWVYERLASLQALGRRFHRAGVPWLLETNAILFEEAVVERKSVALARYARRIELAAYRECDVVICVSDTLAHAVAEVAGVPARKIVVMPNAVDTDLFDPDHHPSREGAVFTVGFVGSLAAWQGLEPLLHAIANLRTGAGVRIQVVIAGDGPMRSRLEALTDALQLGDAVRFLGRVSADRVPAVIAQCDVAYSGHLDPQGREVFRSPLKLYEYMAMAKPVLASSMSDARAIVRSDHGFLFPPGDVAALERAILCAFEKRDRLRQMGEAARNEIVARHSWRVRVKGLIASVREILEARPAMRTSAGGVG
jgi:glycosyltransferase involved in cell wall biosynthesis